MKLKVLLLIGFLVNSSLFSQLKQEKPLSLDVAILLDNSEFKTVHTYAKQGRNLEEIPPLAVTQEMSLLITRPDNAVPFVVTTSLLAGFDTRYDTTFLFNTNYHLYKSKNADFIIVFPEQYLQKKGTNKLANLGFNERELIVIKDHSEFSKIVQSLKEELETTGYLPPINVENLKKLFIPAVNPKDLKIFFTPVKKRIFLSGHGYFKGPSSEALVAGLPLKDFQELLEYFNIINVDLLFISSCYAGGNMKDALKKDQQATSGIIPNYFMIIQSLTDTEAWTHPWQFKYFFETASEFLDDGIIKNCTKARYLECLISAIIYGEFKGRDLIRLENIPLVRFPGTVDYFKAVDADNNLLIITYAKTASKVLEKSKFIAAPKTIVVEGGKYSYQANIKAILIYPIYVKVPIEINQSSSWIPAIISMIPRNAFHIFQELKFNGNFDDLINKALFPLDIVSEKLFLIKNLEIENQTIPELTKGKIQLKNVMIKKPAGPKAVLIIVQFEFNNKFYMTPAMYDPDNAIYRSITYLNEIPAEGFKATITQEINNFAKQMSQDSPYYGHENIADVANKTIDQFVRTPEKEKALEKAVEKTIHFTQSK